MVQNLETARQRLSEIFGFADFRPGQAEVIGNVLAGADVLAVMPTGAGKSLCFQLPALLRPGLTLVVSPLIALMRDQVAQLQRAGIAAASLNSTNAPAENDDTLGRLREGALRLLYVAPERVGRRDLVEMLRRGGVSLLAVDEAHCVSQWGHDFRPDYLALGEVRNALGSVQTLALTATADAPTREDIERRLFAGPPQVLIRSFDRPNLFLAMQPKANARRQIVDFVGARRRRAGIVYCASRKRTEALAEALAAEGHDALPYHAGLDQAVRSRNQDAFLAREAVVMVATIAFGMGIDKPDVRFVCHADLPKTVESYYQEIGRAGRDGLPAETLTLYGLEDMRYRRLQIEDSEASEDRKRIERQRFSALVALCEAPHCRRQTLLSYFGETAALCGNCDLCRNGASRFDGTVDAQKAMSAILRSGERFGTEHLVRILTGTSSDALIRHAHERLPTFGVGADRSAEEWRGIFRQLYAGGLISLDISGHGGWTVTDAGREVLRGDARIELRGDVLPGRRKRGRRGAETQEQGPVDAPLLTALKELRRQIAREQSIPAYTVFADRTLAELAAAKPADLDEMRHIHGVGETKLARFGEAFLDILRRHA